MSQQELFKRLGAPLTNPRWSWGAVRATDGAVFLRVWQDETRNINGNSFMRVTSNEHFQGVDTSNRGWRERLNHVARVRAGAPSYMIMCVAKDIAAVPRQVHSFNEHEVFRGGELTDADNDTWLELGRRVPVREASV